MNKSIINYLEDLFDIHKGNLDPKTILSKMTQWDSMTKLSLIVLASDEFNKKLDNNDIKSFKTVEDIILFLSK